MGIDPTSNPIFSHDFQKFVFQEPNVRMVNMYHEQPKPFEINSPEKSKKSKKEKDSKKDGQDKEKSKPFT